MSRILAVANQKGGVAKTTTVASLGAALAELGLRVLLVDLDAQSSLTYSLGLDPDEVEHGLHDVLAGRVGVREAVVSAADGVDVLPATIDLSATESELATVDEREFVLRAALADVQDAYDVVILDCSPSLGMLTLNALAAADEVIIPLQCEMLSHRGVGQLLDTIEDVQRLLNPSLSVRGVLPTMFDARTAHQQAVLADVAQRYDVPVLHPAIPRSVRFAEAPAVGRSVLTTARRSKGAQAYRQVATDLAGSWHLRPPGRASAAPVRRTRRTPAG